MRQSLIASNGQPADPVIVRAGKGGAGRDTNER